MILFHQDWSLHPTAIWDTSTTNTSWLEFCALLRHMGVKNYLFPLALMNPLLKGVDPFDYPNLTPEIRTAIKVECQLNPWYFFREVFKVPPQGGDVPYQLKANRANISLLWSFFNNIDYFIVQPRQTGKSLALDGAITWYMHFAVSNTRATLLTKDRELLAENITKLHKYRTYLPEYLVNISRDDADNQYEFTYLSDGNRLRGIPAQKNEDLSKRAGRGVTTTFNVCDEFAFFYYNYAAIPSMLASGGNARELVQAQGLPYGNLFATTAGFLDTPHGAYAHEFANSGYAWTEDLYDAVDKTDLYNILQAELGEQALMIYGSFTHRQLGYSDEWLRLKIANARQSGDLAAADFLCIWPKGGLRNPLDAEIMDVIHKSTVEPKYIQIDSIHKFTTRWWIPESEVQAGIPDRTVILGLDMSTAVGKDNISGVFVDASTTEVLGVFKINITYTHKFAVWLANLLVQMPSVTLIPEKANIWISMLDIIISVLTSKGIDPTKRIYSVVVQNKDNSDTYTNRYNEFAMHGNSKMADSLLHYRNMFGFVTNESSREVLFNIILFEAARESGKYVHSAQLASEISTLEERTKGGKVRIEHANGKNDDLVVGWLLTHWLLTYGKNLSHYGIDASRVRRSLIESKSSTDWLDTKRAAEHLGRRDELLELLESNLTAPIHVRMRNKDRIQKLYNELNMDLLDTDTLSSIDTLMKSATDYKRISTGRAYHHRIH